MAELSLSSNQEIFLTLEKQLPGQLAYFISGAAIYYFFDSFYKTAIPLFIASVVVLFLHKYLIDLSFLYPAALAVIVIFFAYKFKYLGNFGKYGDFSFGIYIWHFPIIQLLGHFNLFSNQLLGTLLLLVSVGSMAFLSWHLIEKKFLAKSSHYIIVGKN
jgi:peptidoglycan/LPS O-acetylase OafA/YrhL